MPRKFSGPLQPGRRTAMVPRRAPRKSRKPLTVPTVKTLIKSQALKLTETKRVPYLQEDTQLEHNTTLYLPSFLDTSQGLRNPGANAPPNPGEIRVGNSIVARGMGLKLFIQNNFEHPNLTYKLIIFKYPTIVSSVLSDSRLWQGGDGNGSIMNRMIDTIATNRVKIVYSTIIRPGLPTNNVFPDGVVGGAVKTTLFEKYINLRNLKLNYNEDGGKSPMFTNLGLAMVPYDHYSTAQGTPVARLSYNIKMYFKDP